MTSQTVHDPVCGMTFDPARAASKREYRGAVYHFCSDSCEAEFGREPDRYATPTAEDRTPPRVR